MAAMANLAHRGNSGFIARPDWDLGMAIAAPVSLALSKPPDHPRQIVRSLTIIVKGVRNQFRPPNAGCLAAATAQALATEVNRLMVADGFADLRPADSAVFMGLGSEFESASWPCAPG